MPDVMDELSKPDSGFRPSLRRRRRPGDRPSSSSPLGMLVLALGALARGRGLHFRDRVSSDDAPGGCDT